MPIPRRTGAGKEHTINIGDVGLVRDDLPFHTLFNIAQPKDSPVNGNRVPEGFDPPCIILPDDITMVDQSGEKDMCHIWPKESIMYENVQEDSNGSRLFDFTLTSAHGALLLLPQGSILETLEARNEFLSRIQDHWHQWYDWVEQTKKVDLGDQQTLSIVTGVEKCFTWANASWDSAVGSANLPSLSLKLTVNGSDGRCSWAYPTSRCKTQSAKLMSSGADSVPKQTVFIRGFRVDRRGSIRGSSPPLTAMDLGSDNGDDDESLGGNGHDKDHFRGNGHQQNHSSSSGNSSSHMTGRGSASSFGAGHSGGQSRSDFSQSDMWFTDFSGSGSNSVIHPCNVINNLAFEIISNIDPALLDDGCAAVSHDDDWMSIIHNSDDKLLDETEFIRQIFTELKYVVQGDTIYTSKMSSKDTEIVQQSLISVQNTSTLIPLLVEFREVGVKSEDVVQTAASASASVSETPLLPSSSAPGKWKEEELSNSLNTPSSIPGKWKEEELSNPLNAPSSAPSKWKEEELSNSLNTPSSIPGKWKEEELSNPLNADPLLTHAPEMPLDQPFQVCEQGYTSSTESFKQEQSQDIHLTFMCLTNLATIVAWWLYRDNKNMRVPKPMLLMDDSTNLEVNTLRKYIHQLASADHKERDQMLNEWVKDDGAKQLVLVTMDASSEHESHKLGKQASDSEGLDSPSTHMDDSEQEQAWPFKRVRTKVEQRLQSPSTDESVDQDDTQWRPESALRLFLKPATPADSESSSIVDDENGGTGRPNQQVSNWVDHYIGQSLRASSEANGPSYENRQTLLSNYFCWQGPRNSIVDQRVFENAMRENDPKYCSQFLLYSIYAHTIRYVPNLAELAHEYTARTHLLLSSALSRPSSIPTVQGMLLLAANHAARG
ncbi:hypothetical protein V5O48_016912, partial [Marasmius crinis-equi]